MGDTTHTTREAQSPAATCAKCGAGHNGLWNLCPSCVAAVCNATRGWNPKRP